MTEPLKSLDARYYVDPAIFAIEKQHLLATTWQFAGHESQVKNPGDYFTFSIAGENLFCIRDREGTSTASTTFASTARMNLSKATVTHAF